MQLPEIEFLAEKELVTIEPNFNQGKLYLIGGDVGPFEAGRQLDVPLWLGLHLRQHCLCRILPLPWLEVERLEEIKQREADSPLFTEMPSQYYREMAQLLLGGGMAEVTRASEVQTLVKDLWDMRQTKLRASISDFLKSGSRHASLNHLTPMEVSVARPFLTRALDHLYVLGNSADFQLRASGTQS